MRTSYFVLQVEEATDESQVLAGSGGWRARGALVGTGQPTGLRATLSSLLPLLTLSHLQSATSPSCVPLTYAHCVVTGPAAQPGVTVSRIHSTCLPG